MCLILLQARDSYISPKPDHHHHKTSTHVTKPLDHRTVQYIQESLKLRKKTLLLRIVFTTKQFGVQLSAIISAIDKYTAIYVSVNACFYTSEILLIPRS